MSDDSRISTSKAPKPVGLYPHARRVGDLLFLSGVGPRVAGSDAIDSAVPGLKLDKNGNFIEFDFATKFLLQITISCDCLFVGNEIEYHLPQFN